MANIKLKSKLKLNGLREGKLKFENIRTIPYRFFNKNRQRQADLTLLF